MSIIYEALKKSQKTRAAGTKHKPAMRVNVAKIARWRPPQVSRKNMILISAILSAMFFTLYFLSAQTPPGSHLMFSQEKFVVKPLAANAIKRLPMPHLNLECVFLSENEKLAMINHHSYHVGDKINGMSITSIAMDRVTLQDKQRSLVLRSAMAELD